MKNTDKKWLALAFKLSKKCSPSTTAFCVGAVVVDKTGKKFVTGYSRETGTDKHAEDIAIERAQKEKFELSESTLYSSLEPCGERLSKGKTCTQHIIEANIKRVVFGMYEPSTFVEARGEEILNEAGIETDYIETK